MNRSNKETVKRFWCFLNNDMNIHIQYGMENTNKTSHRCDIAHVTDFPILAVYVIKEICLIKLTCSSN